MKTTTIGPRSACPVARAVEMVGDRWSLLIVRDAFEGRRRFGDFVASLGIARNILTHRLKILEQAGILATAPAADGSAYKEYVLTEGGRNLFPVLIALRQWGEQQLYARGEAHSRLVERTGGRVVPKLQVRGTSGALLRPEDTLVRSVSAQRSDRNIRPVGTGGDGSAR